MTDHEAVIRQRRADVASAQVALDDAVRAAAADGVGSRRLTEWSGIARMTIRHRVLAASPLDS